MIVTVQPFDTLESIATAYHTTPQTIAEVNRLGEAPLLAGMRLLVTGYLLHLWLPTDTVDDVAALYGVPTDAVGIGSHTPAAGQMVRITV